METVDRTRMSAALYPTLVTMTLTAGYRLPRRSRLEAIPSPPISIAIRRSAVSRRSVSRR
jgi:hypothetical protein